MCTYDLVGVKGRRVASHVIAIALRLFEDIVLKVKMLIEVDLLKE